MITGVGHNRKEGRVNPLLRKVGLPTPFDNYNPFDSYVYVARLWDVERCRELASFDDCEQVLYSPDGKVLATAHRDGTVRLWDLPPRKPVVRIVVESVVLCLALLLGVRLAAWLVRRAGLFARRRP